MKTIPASDPSLVSIVGLDKACVLAALYNAARDTGIGTDRLRLMTVEEAREIIKDSRSLSFGLLNGRMIFCDISGDRIDVGSYNRANSDDGASSSMLVAEAAIARLHSRRAASVAA